MLLPPYLIPFLKIIYPIEEPKHTRDRPLEVLAVGLSRSGTDSLRTALKQLGYNECHHGFVVVAEEIGQAPQWCRLAWRKQHSDPLLPLAGRGLDATEFDKCIGNCAAVTDMPCAGFACELIRAYPEAKVIVNRRNDVEAWYQSVLRTIEKSDPPSPFKLWRNALFDADLFWVKGCRSIAWDNVFEQDFVRNGRDVYRQHYEKVDELLDAEAAAGRSREVLRWQVSDGWDPLVRFLGKEVPVDEDGKRTDFPSGNAPDDFVQRRLKMAMEKVKRADRRRSAFYAGVIALVLAGMAKLVWI